MAFGNAVWCVDTNGNDTNNGGGYDARSSGLTVATNGKVTSGTTSAPVFSSASYSFQSQDIGHWIWIKSGTNWYPGWYKITAVSGGAATLDATAGHINWYNAGGSAAVGGIAFHTGCVTSSYVSGTASGSWAIDYSRSSGNTIYTYTDLVIDATTNTKVTSAGHPFSIEQVGNIISITSGTGFTVQRVTVLSVTAGVATCDKSLGTLGSTGGNGKMGGQLASVGLAGSLVGTLSGQCVFIRSGNYNITSATTNISGGCFSQTSGYCRMEGFETYYCDLGDTPKLIAASSINTFTVITMSGTTSFTIANIDVNCTSYTSSRAFNIAIASAIKLVARNCTNSGIVISNNTGWTVDCTATGCTTAGAGISITTASPLIGCAAYANSVHGFSASNASSFAYCIAANNTGATTDGFNGGSSLGFVHNCTAYGNGRHGFNFGGAASDGKFFNCVAEGNGGWGFTATGGVSATFRSCATYNNTSGGIDYAVADAVYNEIVYTASAFIDPSNNNLALNFNVGGGQSLRGTGSYGAFERSMGSTGYLDIGAAQSPYASPTFGEHAHVFFGHG
jgi:hypothetical protein